MIKEFYVVLNIDIFIFALSINYLRNLVFTSELILILNNSVKISIVSSLTINIFANFLIIAEFTKSIVSIRSAPFIEFSVSVEFYAFYEILSK